MHPSGDRGRPGRDRPTGFPPAAVLRLIADTESLAALPIRYTTRGSDALEEALREAGVEPLTTRLAAVQVIVVQQEPAVTNQERLAAGTSADEHHPEAVRATERAFDLLRDGLGQHGQGPSLA
ncbi:hypothetical protein AB0D10_12865 [Kitasatospora sp. NPDC048545]|uniref:hypothetical protein n=1 Tax=Kitasatospora sp. NPDC048545 TaxID=3157208 RepID=UPI0033EAF775